MAMTNLNYNNQNDTNPKQQLTEPSPKQLPNGHYTNYTAANLSNLSPIYEGEIFASPTATISPSISHNTIDNNHVVLFNHGPPKLNNEPMAVSPTTSTSSSNSSNTPTPTTCNTANCHSNSLFNIDPSTNNAHCIPSVGLMSANLSKTSTSSSSPSPSLDTTVSPVTKMDLYRDLKIFEEMDTETSNNNVTVDYLTGDTHCDYHEKPAKAAKTNKHRVSTTPVMNGCCVTTDFPNIYNLPHSTKSMPEITGNGHVPAPHSPLNSNSNDHKTRKKCTKMGKQAANTSSKHKKSDKHRHRHCHPHRHRHSRSRKKKRKKSAENSYSDSDSELQKKGKMKEKIKNISILVPGDPNGLYKYWKRTKSHKKRPKHTKKPQSQCNANDPLSIKNRDRLNSFPPNNHIYPKQSPRPHLHTFHTLSSPSSSNSNSSSMGSSLSVPIKICKSQSLSNLQDTELSKAIIIHTPTNHNHNDENQAYNEYSFSVMGLRNYSNQRVRHRQHQHQQIGCDLMSHQRVRMNTYPPYGDITDNGHRTAPKISLIIERVSPSPGLHSRTEANSKEPQWHYTSRTDHRQDNVAGEADRGKYGCYGYPKANKVILREKWKDEEEDVEIASLPLECLSEPNASHIKGKRRRRKIAQSQKNLYNIHPSMPSFMKNKNNHSNHGKLHDL